MPHIEKLQSDLDLTFSDICILHQAVTHSSYINENPGKSDGDSQRMEFLGDALLNFLVAELLFSNFPEWTEGRLTETRITMIKQDKLAEKASALKLGAYLLLGRGEDVTGGREKRNNLADAYEAVLAAIYLDRGIEAARQFISNQFHSELQNISEGCSEHNFKTLLQQVAQSEFKSLPEYEIVESAGPDHDRIFVVSVALGDVVLAIGSGKTKKLAETEAARSAYLKLVAEQGKGA